jgi:hypothetical protein
MTFPHSHKTVLVLDRGAYFEGSSQQPIDFDMLTKVRGPVANNTGLSAICKSMWTCNVEACLEFCRIVFDLHPYDRCVSRRFINVSLINEHDDQYQF